jgi:hypothetical protein
MSKVLTMGITPLTNMCGYTMWLKHDILATNWLEDHLFAEIHQMNVGRLHSLQCRMPTLPRRLPAFFFKENWTFIVKVSSPAKSRGLIGWCLYKLELKELAPSSSTCSNILHNVFNKNKINYTKNRDEVITSSFSSIFLTFAWQRY